MRDSADNGLPGPLGIHGPVLPPFKALAVKLTEAACCIQQEVPEVGPQDMLKAMVTVTCGFAACHRVQTQSAAEMAAWFAAYVHTEFLEAHDYITKRRAAQDPAG